MIEAIDAAKRDGDTLGGVFEVVIRGVPVGLGSHVSWDRKLDGRRLAGALMSIQAIKGVEIGLGFEAARRPGSRVHDEIVAAPEMTRSGGYGRAGNHAGGLEGGITTGMPLVMRAAMKPISTLMRPLRTVDVRTGEPALAVRERSDVCALPAAAVVGEAMTALVLAAAVLEKFGGDSLAELRRNHDSFVERLQGRRRLVLRSRLSRRAAARFVAGETLDQSIAAAREMNSLRMSVTLDYLGESVSRKSEAIAAADMAIRTLECIAAERIDGNICIKPSQLGLRIDEAFCRANVERVLDAARALGDRDGEIFVRLDMEASDATDATLALTEALWRSGRRNVGTVLQSYLRRTPDDLHRLVRLGTRIRLVKCAYREPPEVAFPKKRDVDHRFVEQMKDLLENGAYPAIATHDEVMIEATRRWAAQLGISMASFEFQMLYGVRRDLQKRLRDEGYRVRVYIPFGESWYPYLMRRLAERPANLAFIVGSLLGELGPNGARRHDSRAGSQQHL